MHVQLPCSYRGPIGPYMGAIPGGSSLLRTRPALSREGSGPPGPPGSFPGDLPPPRSPGSFPGGSCLPGISKILVLYVKTLLAEVMLARWCWRPKASGE